MSTQEKKKRIKWTQAKLDMLARLRADGKTHKEIAGEVGASELSVSKQLRNNDYVRDQLRRYTDMITEYGAVEYTSSMLAGMSVDSMIWHEIIEAMHEGRIPDPTIVNKDILSAAMKKSAAFGAMHGLEGGRDPSVVVKDNVIIAGNVNVLSPEMGRMLGLAKPAYESLASPEDDHGDEIDIETLDAEYMECDDEEEI